MKLLRTLGTASYCCLLALLSFVVIFSSAVPVRAATRYESGISTNASLLRMKDKALARRLDDIKALGATWVRIDFSWAIVQPDSASQYDWELYDRIVREVGARDLKILAVLGYTPAWAREPACDKAIADREIAKRCAPQSDAEFSRFAAVASYRYKGQAVRAWEIWNEPNLAGHWKSVNANGTLFVDPLAYARVANAAAQQIRYHYPDSLIIVGGLAPMFEPRFPVGMRQSDFLSQAMPHLNKDYFDAVGIHPYTWPVLPSKAEVYNAFYTVDNGDETYNLRSIMAANKWNDKEIWATEFGAGTQGARVSSRLADIQKYGRPDHVTEDVQAQIIRQGMDEWHHKNNVGPMFVHSDSDRYLTPHKPGEAGFGLRRKDGSKKPAYDAFQAGSRELR